MGISFQFHNLKDFGVERERERERERKLKIKLFEEVGGSGQIDM
jgi:hypothetical protein